MSTFCQHCRHIPCQCSDLCHGCDSPLGEDRLCASCEETMPTYRWPSPLPRVTTPVRKLDPSIWGESISEQAA